MSSEAIATDRRELDGPRHRGGGRSRDVASGASPATGGTSSSPRRRTFDSSVVTRSSTRPCDRSKAVNDVTAGAFTVTGTSSSPTGAGRRIGRQVDELGEQLEAGDAVEQGVVDLGDDRHPRIVCGFGHVQLPQGAVAGELVAQHVGGERRDRCRGQVGEAWRDHDVVSEVESGILDPHRGEQATERVAQALPEQGHAGQALRRAGSGADRRPVAGRRLPAPAPPPSPRAAARWVIRGTGSRCRGRGGVRCQPPNQPERPGSMVQDKFRRRNRYFSESTLFTRPNRPGSRLRPHRRGTRPGRSRGCWPDS